MCQARRRETRSGHNKGNENMHTDVWHFTWLSISYPSVSDIINIYVNTCPRTSLWWLIKWMSAGRPVPEAGEEINQLCFKVKPNLYLPCAFQHTTILRGLGLIKGELHAFSPLCCDIERPSRNDSADGEDLCKSAHSKTSSIFISAC